MRIKAALRRVVLRSTYRAVISFLVAWPEKRDVLRFQSACNEARARVFRSMSWALFWPSACGDALGPILHNLWPQIPLKHLSSQATMNSGFRRTFREAPTMKSSSIQRWNTLGRIASQTSYPRCPLMLIAQKSANSDCIRGFLLQDARILRCILNAGMGDGVHNDKGRSSKVFESEITEGIVSRESIRLGRQWSSSSGSPSSR